MPSLEAAGVEVAGQHVELKEAKAELHLELLESERVSHQLLYFRPNSTPVRGT